MVGGNITVKAIFEEGSEVREWLVTDKNGNKLDIEFNDNGNGTYSFVMPDQQVKIKANITKIVDYESFYGTYYNYSNGNIIALKENNVAQYINGADVSNATYEIISYASGKENTELGDDGKVVFNNTWLYDLVINDGNTTKTYSVDGFSINDNGVIYKELGNYTVNYYLDKYDITPYHTQKVGDYNYKITDIEAPTKEGYKFAGWYFADGSEFDSDEMVVKTLSVYAKWEPLTETDKASCNSSMGSLPLTIGSVMILFAVALLLKRRSCK